MKVDKQFFNYNNFDELFIVVIVIVLKNKIFNNRCIILFIFYVLLKFIVIYQFNKSLIINGKV